ncbi:MAG: transposase [Acidobacteria bacterium]|nr:transposase [Acidobacteriota bacterium]
MARPLRLEHPGAIWHVTARGNGRCDIVRSDRDRSLFTEILGDVVSLSRWRLHAWVLMRNHYHLLLETPEPTLSYGVKRLNETWAQTFNARHRRVGHLFQGRFKGILVERESHLLELVRYTVLNPVRCGAVTHASDYQWSNYRATAGLGPVPLWLDSEWTLSQFGSGSFSERCEAYRRFVADGRGASYNPWEQLVGRIYLGGDAFRDKMQSMVGDRREIREHSREERIFVRPALETVIALVSVEFSLSIERLRKRSHAPARKALAELAWKEAEVPLESIGHWLGITGQAAGQLVRRSEALARSDPGYAEALRSLVQQLQDNHSTAVR